VDPIALIVTALAAGADPSVPEEVDDAYERLREAVRQRLAEHLSGESALARYEAEPQTGQELLSAALALVKADDDASLVAAALAVMKMAGRAGKYASSVSKSQGVQAGDKNMQVNYFFGEQSGLWDAAQPTVQSSRSKLSTPIPALSADVREVYRPALSVALTSPDLPVSWTFHELSELHRKVEADGRSMSKAADVLTALCEALIAKPVFLEIGGTELELAQLQVIYRREIGAWPDGNSADALLAEAASAGITERRHSAPSGSLGSLARFVVGVAAELRVAPQSSAAFTHWIGSAGHQLADAQAHYRRRQDDSAWLVIDLGDEPRHGAAAWPTMVTWTFLATDDELAGEPMRCEPTADGLRKALAEILRIVPPARPLLVDLVVPRGLMDEGVEHWPVLDVDGCLEPLSAKCCPRLRWSRRRRDPRLHNRLLDRIDQASWRGDARHWVQNDPRFACFLGGRDTQSSEDLLRVLLREGCGFAIWFPSGLPTSAVRQIARAVRKVPVPARRHALPDQLPEFSEGLPAVIWDDPQGRGAFRLPPLVVPESP
jgi:hypothetical protein